MMRFTVCGSAPGAGAERLGQLVTRSGVSLPTPRAALLTRAGSVPHLTREVLDRLSPDPRLLASPLSSCLHLEKGAQALGGGLGAFCGSRPADAWLVMPSDASVDIPVGHFRGDDVPLWTRHGKVMINAERYMDVMETFRPDAYVALADDRTDVGEGRKRHQRAALRSNAMLDACVARHRRSEQLRTSSALIGVLTGWGCGEAAEWSAERVASHADTLAGVALAGGVRPGAAERATADQLPSRLAEILARIGPDKLRLVPGCWSVSYVLACVALGCDVFDTSLPARLADRGSGLVFPLREGVDGDFVIDLNNTVYKDQFTPLLRDCKCVTCSRYTRAYVHHLLRTRELLAPLLITLHNLHHYAEFFTEIRRHIAEGTFQQYKSFITHRHESYLAAYPVSEEPGDSKPMDTPVTKGCAVVDDHPQSNGYAESNDHPQSNGYAESHDCLKVNGFGESEVRVSEEGLSDVIKDVDKFERGCKKIKI